MRPDLPKKGTPSAGPHFRPRVIVKFHDWVEVPYEDGAEKYIFEKYGKAPWAKLQEAHGQMTLKRLYTAVSPKGLQELVDKATERDQSYRPSNFFTWFTIDAPDGMRSEELLSILREWELVEKAYADAKAIGPVTPGDDPRSAYQGYLDPAPDGIDAEYAWGPTIAGGDGAGQRVIDLEQGWTLDHEDLIAHGATLLFGTLVYTSRPHGTSVT